MVVLVSVSGCRASLTVNDKNRSLEASIMNDYCFFSCLGCRSSWRPVMSKNHSNHVVAAVVVTFLPQYDAQVSKLLPSGELLRQPLPF